MDSPPLHTPPSTSFVSQEPALPTRQRALTRPRREGDSEDEDDFDDTFGLPFGRETSSSDSDKHIEGVEGGEGGVEQRERSQRGRKPFFFPPLWLARRTFIADLLKSEAVTSVADLGCGSGSLLSLLALPAYHLDPFPPLFGSFNPLTTPTSTLQAKLDVLRSLPPLKPQEQELHLKKLIGVDMSAEACAAAAENCARAGAGREDAVGNETRWEELEVGVWEGGVEIENEELKGLDAIVLTEVNEHLTPDAFSRLPSLLFSVYKPRLIIITTPNHSFAPYFASPSSLPAPHSRHSAAALAHSEDSHLHLDPTGRTSRLFRDPTHLFEFTSAEFRSWALSLASTTPGAEQYDLTFDGLGSLAEYYGSVSPGGYNNPQVPFPPPSEEVHEATRDEETTRALPEDPKTFWATQTVVFRRREGGSASGVVAKIGDGETSSALPSSSPSPPVPTASHSLHASFTLPPHPPLPSPPSHSSILATLQRLFISARRGSVLSLAELWRFGVGPSASSLSLSLSVTEPSSSPAPTASSSPSPSPPADTSPRPPLRELTAGRLSPLLNALLSDEAGEEWELENLAALEKAKEGGGGGREVSGMESLVVRWRGYVEPDEEGEGEDRWEQEEGSSSGEEEGKEDDEEDGKQYVEVPALDDERSRGGWGESSATGAWGSLSRAEEGEVMGGTGWGVEKEEAAGGGEQEVVENTTAGGGWVGDDW